MRGIPRRLATLGILLAVVFARRIPLSVPSTAAIRPAVWRHASASLWRALAMTLCYRHHFSLTH